MTDSVIVGTDTDIRDEFCPEENLPPAPQTDPSPSLPGPSTSSAAPSTEPATLTTVKTHTLSESELILRQFQKFMMTDEQIAEFEDFFSRGVTDPHPLFQSWLPLRKATIRTEEEALDLVLLRTVPRAEPRKAAKRKASAPLGPAGNDPTSPEWEEKLRNAELRALQKAGSAGRGRGRGRGRGSRGGRGRGVTGK